MARVEVIPLMPSDYDQALRIAMDTSTTGGTIYDLLHLIAAKNWGASQIATLNVRHFEPFTDRLSLKIVAP